MKPRFLKWPLLVLAAVTVFSACKKESEGENNDEEVITTLTLKIAPHTGGAAVNFSYDDPDGPGGNEPTRQEIVLSRNAMYHFEVELLDKTKDPDANLTSEVVDEGEAHRIYYLPSAGSNITISGLNNDINGIPLGTTAILSTGAAGTGTLRVVLRHYGGNPPSKAAGDAVDSPKASSDVDVTFNTRVQ